VRVSHALDLPCVTGIKELQIEDGVALAGREGPGGWELFEVDLPAVLTVKEGINLPRYPSLPGRLKAKKKPVAVDNPQADGGGLQMVRLANPPEQQSDLQLLGDGPDAASRIVDILQELKLV